MNRLFGKSTPAPPAPSLADISANLDKRVDSFDAKIKLHDAKILKYSMELKKMPPGPAKEAVQKRAVAELKMRKHYERLRDNSMQQAFNLDQVKFTTEMLIETKGTIDAMKAGVNQMKKEYKNLNINEIEDLQDEMEDMIADSNEIQDVLGRTYGFPEIDESELEAEFAAIGDGLEQEADLNLYDDIATSNVLPSSVPATAPKDPVREPTEVVSSPGLNLSSDPSVSTTDSKDPIKEPW